MTEPGTDVPEIDVDELARLRTEAVPLIDVRQPDEYREAHAPGAVLIPLDQLQGRLGEVPRGERVAVICAGGGRSAKATAAFLAEGIDAVNVAGGTRAWIEAGYEVATGDEPG